VTSDELNEAISAICDDNSLYEAFGGKCIPYIGWFWRRVNFDQPDHEFGVLLPNTSESDPNPVARVGFMENNKWDYDYVYCPHDKWVEIKELLEAAVMSPSHGSLRAADRAIQALLG